MRQQRVIQGCYKSDAARNMSSLTGKRRALTAFCNGMQGCPKHFSVQGGMGAALLRKPETVEDIIKTLKRNINIPITVSHACIMVLSDFCVSFQRAAAQSAR